MCRSGEDRLATWPAGLSVQESCHRLKAWKRRASTRLSNAFAGGADPQDPVANLFDLERHFPDSYVVAFPHLGHSRSGVGGCIDPVVTDFVERGTTKGLDTTGSDGVVVVPPFPLTS